MIEKLFRYFLLCAFTLIFGLSDADCGSAEKELLTSAERVWLTENLARITLAVETGYPPFVFLDSKNTPIGFAHDYLLLVEEKLGVRFRKRQFSTLDEIFGKVRAGEVQIVNAVTNTPGRSGFLAFTEPFISVPNVIVVRKERTGKLQEKELSGMKVSLVKSYAITEHLAKPETGVAADIVADDLTAILNVSFGRSDAAVVDLATASYLISVKGITNLRVAGEASQGIKLSMAVPRSEAVLRGILQKGIDAVTEKERYIIEERWIYAQDRSIFSDRRLVWGALAVAGLISAVILWNRLLRRQVAANTEDLVRERELLRLSEFRQRAMIENIVDVIAIIDQQGINRYKSPNIEKWFGWRPEDVVGDFTWKQVHPDDVAGVKETFTSLLEEPDASKIGECRYLCRDGSYKWIEYTAVNLLGHPDISGVLLSYHDITKRRCAQEAQLNEKAFLRSLIDSADDLIYFKDTKGVYLGCNRASEKFIGLSESEQIGKNDFDFLDREVAQRVVSDDRRVMESGAAVRSEEWVTRSDGSRVLLDTVKTPIVTHDGQVLGLVGFSRDITDLKKMQDEKLTLEKQLLHTQKLESLGVLAGGIAHDFNNILMAIIGNADLALMRINPESPAAENLHRIEKAAAQAADLARQMLAYSGKGKFVVEHLDMNRLLEEMLHMLDVSISKKAVLRLNLFPNLPPVEADSTQMRQIIMNLVINASEAIGDKSGIIAITTGCMDCDERYLKDVWLHDNLKDGLYVYIEIADTGCGMNKETMAKIFDPFFTTKFTGRGLGMAAVLGIVRGHKGAIKVYSEPRKGTTFKILLPASERPAELFNGHASVDGWRGSGTVLLVDDEESVRGIGREMLQELGFSVVTADDGRQGVAVFRENPDISIVILDLTMPHMDGEQCFRELRRIRADVRVIMSSGYNEQEVTQKFVGKGLAGFIQKPYKLSTLKEAIIRIS